MTNIITLEQLQTRNQALTAALEKVATANHYAQRDNGSIEHRVSFHNCPSPDCVEVRVLLGQEVGNKRP